MALSVGSAARADEDVAALVGQLRSGDEAARVVAAQRLASLGPSARDAVEGLMAALDDTPKVRLAAVQALGKIGPDAAPAARVLAGMLVHNVVDRRIIARAMADIGAPSVPQLQKLLRHEDLDVRLAAIEALGWIGPAAKAAAGDLIALMRDQEKAVRMAAAHAVRSVVPGSPESAPLLIEFLGADDEPIRWAMVDTLVAMGRPGIDALAGALEADNMWVRLYAVRALGKAKDQTELVLPLLVRALKDSHWGVRQDAAQRLGKFGPAASQTLPALFEAFTDEDSRVTHDAARAVLAIDPMAIGQAMRHPKAGVRAYACYWPANWGKQGEIFVPQMLTLLAEDPAPDVRYRAARGLEHFPARASEIVPGLIAALEDENSHVHAGVCIALKQMEPKAVDAVPALVDVYRRLATPRHTQNPLQKIVHVGSIHTSTQRSAKTLRELAPLAIPGISKDLASPDQAKRRRAAELLSVMGESATQAVPLLVRLLAETADEVTRRHVLDALINIGPAAQPAVPHLVALLAHEEPDVRGRALMALGAIGPDARRATAKIVERLEDESAPVRCHALVALAKVAEPDVSVGYLAAALSDRGPFHVVARQAVVPTLG
ncbi:MAG: HEAT repeat domain-containing protein, partial [Planctomycetes bacterium]|nr:HEAT repeat domain-containing protein [Planctomycetota bacterium]